MLSKGQEAQKSLLSPWTAKKSSIKIAVHPPLIAFNSQLFVFFINASCGLNTWPIFNVYSQFSCLLFLSQTLFFFKFASIEINVWFNTCSCVILLAFWGGADEVGMRGAINCWFWLMVKRNFALHELKRPLKMLVHIQNKFCHFEGLRLASVWTFWTFRGQKRGIKSISRFRRP